MIGNKIAGIVAKIEKLHQEPIQKQILREEEILRERFIPPELKHKIVNDLRLKE